MGLIVVGDVCVAGLDLGDKSHKLVQGKTCALKEFFLVQQISDADQKLVFLSGLTKSENVKWQVFDFF